MADFNNLALTSRGLKALLDAQAGASLTLSKIGMGSGSTTSGISALTNMITPELILPITEKKISSDSGHLTIVAKMTNENMTEGFYWRETGLFFEDENGNDVLFAYACISGDQYDYVPAYSDKRYVKHIRIANIVTDAANITIKEGEGLLYVDTLTFEEYKAEIKDRMSNFSSHTGNTNNPHGVTSIQVGAVTAVGIIDSATVGYDTLLEYLTAMKNDGHIAITAHVSGFSDLPRTDWTYGCEARLQGNIQVQIWRSLSYGKEGLLLREVANTGVWGTDWVAPYALKSELAEEVAGRQNAVATEKAERKAEIAVERERINQFTKLGEGSTTGDAEMIDARIDFEGNTHDCVGDAVRYQSAKLKENFNAVENSLSKEITHVYVSAEVEIPDSKPAFNSTYGLASVYQENGKSTGVFAVTQGMRYKIIYRSILNTGDDEQNPIGFISTEKKESATGNDNAIRYNQAILLDFKESATQERTIYVDVENSGFMYIVNPISVSYEVTRYIKDGTKGMLVTDDAYTHFTYSHDGIYICREFKHAFVNNLLQLYQMYTAKIIDGSLIKVADIGISSSDIIGPVSIHRGEVDGYVGKWSGGSHGIKIGDTEFPTAEETLLKIYVDGKEVNENGMYYGNVTIITENDLYFPHTITENGLTDATKAIKEKRIYKLNEKMNVEVYLSFYNKTAITSYYGLQCIPYGMDMIVLPNNEKEMSLRPSETYFFENKEDKYYCYNTINNARYDVELHNIGLGKQLYAKSESLKFGNVATFHKVYFQLISDGRAFNTDETLMWSGCYDYYFD